MKKDDNMHIEDLIFSFNGKIIAERKSNLASCTHAWHCSYLLGAALNYIFHGLNHTSPVFHKCIPANSPGFAGSLQVFYQISRSPG